MDVLKTVVEIAGKEFDIQKAPRREGDIVSITADTSRIKSLTDWEAKHDDLEEIIKSSYEWEDRLAKKNHY